MHPKSENFPKINQWHIQAFYHPKTWKYNRSKFPIEAPLKCLFLQLDTNYGERHTKWKQTWFLVQRKVGDKNSMPFPMQSYAPHLTGSRTTDPMDLQLSICWWMLQMKEKNYLLIIVKDQREFETLQHVSCRSWFLRFEWTYASHEKDKKKRWNKAADTNFASLTTETFPAQI